jgi:hypothetical protein
MMGGIPRGTYNTGRFGRHIIVRSGVRSVS